MWPSKLPATVSHTVQSSDVPDLSTEAEEDSLTLTGDSVSDRRTCQTWKSCASSQS